MAKGNVLPFNASLLYGTCDVLQCVCPHFSNSRTPDLSDLQSLSCTLYLDLRYSDRLFQSGGVTLLCFSQNFLDFQVTKLDSKRFLFQYISSLGQTAKEGHQQNLILYLATFLHFSKSTYFSSFHSLYFFGRQASPGILSCLPSPTHAVSSFNLSFISRAHHISCSEFGGILAFLQYNTIQYEGHIYSSREYLLQQ